MGVARMVWVFLRGMLADRTALMAENMALRQQINVLQRSVKRPKLRKRDRVLWAWLSRLWPPPLVPEPSKLPTSLAVDVESCRFEGTLRTCLLTGRPQWSSVLSPGVDHVQRSLRGHFPVQKGREYQAAVGPENVDGLPDFSLDYVRIL